MILRSFFTWFYSGPTFEHSRLEIVVWWEKRRIPYNLIVGVIGFISLLFFYLFIDLAHGVKPGEDAVEPMALILAPIAINICYTGGWLVELILSFFKRNDSRPIGPILLKAGVIFSIVMVLIPSVFWFITFVLRSI